MDWEIKTKGFTTIYRTVCPSSEFTPLPQVGEGKLVPETDIKKMGEAMAKAWEKLADSLIPDPEQLGKPVWNCFFCQIWHSQGILKIVPGHTKKVIQPNIEVEVSFAHIQEAAKSLKEKPDPYLHQEARLRNPIERAIKKSFRDNATKAAMRKLAKTSFFKIFRQIEDKEDRLMELEDFKMFL